MKPKLGILFTLVMVAALVLVGCKGTPTVAAPTQAPKAAAVKVVIATDASFPPMEFVDANKQIVGFDIDMMNAIAKVMGFEVEYKNTAWDGIFAGLESGDYDAVLSAVTITDEKKAVYDFSDPYINAGQAVIVRADETTIKSHQDLPGKTAGAQIGTTGAYAVQNIQGATLKEYDTIDLALLDLVSGNLDAVVVDTPVAADYALASNQFKGKLKIVGEPFTDEWYGVVVRKGEQADFIAAFNEGLKKIKADGTFDQIFAKWISDQSASPVAVAPASVPPAPGFPVKLAIVVPLSGDVKTFGESTRDGALMAIEEAKAAGWQIDVVFADSKCDAQEAANAANKVIFEDGVKYLIGEVCSSASIPISEIADANGVLQISPTSTNPAVTINEDGSTKPYVFRACFLDPFQGEVMANLALELGAKTSAVLFDVGNDYVKGLAEYYKAAFEKMGGAVPVFEAYTKDDTDFSAVLGKVAAANVDVLFLPDYYSKNNLIAAQVKEKGITATLLGGDGWDSPELRFDLFEGGYHSNHYSPADPRPLVQNFVKAYEAKYGMVPDALATLAYDAAKILLQSISEAGVDDPSVAKDKMAAIKYDGVSGEITYDAQNNPVKKAAIIKIEGGKPTFFKFVAPGGAGEEAPSVAAAPGFPVKLAIVVPLSGDVKTFGESTRDGALMAIEEAKAAGWQIDVVFADSKCDAQEAANAANKVIFEDGVKYLIGEVCSSASIPISEIADANGVLQISPTSTNPAVTINEDGSTKPYVFRACFLDPFQGEVMANLALELGAKTSAVLFDVGNDYVKGLAEYYKAAFEKMGGAVPVFEAYTKDDTDFSAVLGKVAAANVDVLFLPDYYSKNNLIAAQVKEKGITATLLGGDGWDSPELRFDLFEGGYHSNHYSPADPRPLVQNFVKAYEAKYGMVPDALATLAYDAAKILLQSISEAGVDDPSVAKDKMAAIKYDGVSGEITYDAQNNPVKKAAIIKIEGGKPTFFKFVAP
jgi:branched-chain amino acid transport system substrate-binding protein